MNNYFRLLFVGSVLFILLGAFSEQPEDSLTHTRAAREIKNMEFQPGILPGLILIPQSYSYFSPKPYPNGFRAIGIHIQEDPFTLKSGTLLASAESVTCNKKLLIMHKTGQFLHRYDDVPEPSHS